MKDFAKIAFEEYASEETSVKQGGVGAMPFWNANSSQFTYAPAFGFPSIPGAAGYIFSATDSKGDTYEFTAETPTAPHYPIWNKLAPGFVELRVEAEHARDGKKYLAGARTFFKMDPFPGRDALPRRALPR